MSYNGSDDNDDGDKNEKNNFDTNNDNNDNNDNIENNDNNENIEDVDDDEGKNENENENENRNKNGNEGDHYYNINDDSNGHVNIDFHNDNIDDNCKITNNISMSISVKDGSDSCDTNGNGNIDDTNNQIGIKSTVNIMKKISSSVINKELTLQKAIEVTKKLTTDIKESKTNHCELQLSLNNNDTEQGTGPRSSYRGSALGYVKTRGDDMGRVDRGWSDADQALFSKVSVVDREW